MELAGRGRIANTQDRKYSKATIISAMMQADGAWIDLGDIHVVEAQWKRRHRYWMGGVVAEVLFAFAGCCRDEEEETFFKPPFDKKAPHGIPKRRCVYKRPGQVRTKYLKDKLSSGQSSPPCDKLKYLAELQQTYRPFMADQSRLALMFMACGKTEPNKNKFLQEMLCKEQLYKEPRHYSRTDIVALCRGSFCSQEVTHK